MSSTSSSSSSSTLISTNELLSTIIHATLHGSSTIRTLATSARGGGDDSSEENSNTNKIQYKETGDARSALTIADIGAQRVIISSLLHKWEGKMLNIVGEEDDTVQQTVVSEYVRELDECLLEHSNLSFYLPTEQQEESSSSPPPEILDLNEVILYIDPLDGTREFVEGRFDNVQCLIGVTYKGQPLMGCCGLPFPSTTNGYNSDSMNNSTEVVFGLVGCGVGKAGMCKDTEKIVSCDLPPLKHFNDGDGVLSISSGDSSSVRPAVELATNTLSNNGKRKIEHQIVGACGNKVLRVAYGQTTICIQHDKTSLWDTAAPTAILVALGGMVTDYFGDPLIYNKKKDVLGNKLGVVASGPGAEKEHLRLVNAMRGDVKCLSILKKYGLEVLGEKDEITTTTSSQCVDIVRDLDGYPLPVTYFGDKLNIPNVKSYFCPESEAVRGIMSNACRIHISSSSEEKETTTTVFYKRIIFENLSHAQEKMKSAPHKLIRDVNSYKVETSFLSSKACRAVIERTGVHIPRCYDAQLEPNDLNPIESKFSVLLEDLSPADGWSQRWLLEDEEECKASLSTFAKLHAFFWHGSSFWNDKDAAQELEAGVWESASYVQPRLQTLNQCQNVAKGWESNRMKCEKELSSFDFWDNLGTRLELSAENNGRQAHPFAENGSIANEFQKYRTLVHGDPKQANLFFRSSGDDNIDVGLIDFQWSGFGLAATDIAHFLTAAVHADRLNDGGEEALLQYYYENLQKYLIEYGVYTNADDAAREFSYDTFMKQYETGVLDMCRLVIAYAWSRFEPVDKDDEAGCKRTMNKNSYNKSLPNVVWLMSRCDGIMKARGM